MDRAFDRPRTPVFNEPPTRSRSSTALNVRSPPRVRAQSGLPPPHPNTASSTPKTPTRPQSARKARNTDEMRIQVHGDGVVEFSVMLGSNVDANHLASLVNAVRSSTGREQQSTKSSTQPPKATTPSMAKIDAALQQSNSNLSPEHATSPDLKPFTRPPFRRAHASVPRNLGGQFPPRAKTPPYRSSHTPRLPDRCGKIERPSSPPPLSALPLDPPPNRSISQPDLGNRQLEQSPAYDENLSMRHVSMPDQTDTPMLDAEDLQIPEPRSVSYGVAGHGKGNHRNLSSPKNRNNGNMNSVLDETHGKQWFNVDYDLRAAYRRSDAPPPSKMADKLSGQGSFSSLQENIPAPTNGTRPRWRLLARMRNIRGRKAEKKVMLDRKDKLAAQPEREPRIHVGSSGALGGFLDGSKGAVEGDEWLEFSTLMSRELAMSEVMRFAKLRGNQVWRRPGEHKLRCIRKLSRNNEMHMVIVIEAHPTTGGTLVRVRRARGDRGRTEWWRYLHFYRDIMARLSASGHSVIPLQRNAAHGLPFRPIS